MLAVTPPPWRQRIRGREAVSGPVVTEEGEGETSPILVVMRVVEGAVEEVLAGKLEGSGRDKLGCLSEGSKTLKRELLEIYRQMRVVDDGSSSRSWKGLVISTREAGSAITRPISEDEVVGRGIS